MNMEMHFEALIQLNNFDLTTDDTTWLASYKVHIISPVYWYNFRQRKYTR